MDTKKERENRSGITIATVAEFHEQLGNLETEDETNFLFRGQANVKWPVDCSAARRLTKYSANSIDDQLINFLLVGYLEFLIAKARMRGFIPPGLSENPADLEFLAQLQHQGAATGLIDFTRRPLVALWFACNATREEDRKADGAVYALSRSKTQAVSKRDFEEKKIQDFYEENKLWLWEPSAIGNRIVAQGSIFVFGVSRIYPTQMKQLIIQANNKDNILKELETLYGINEEELFADFSGYAIANASSRIFDVNRAIDYWHEQIELASDSNDDSKKVRAHFNCGVAYSAIKALKKAIEQYGKAIKLNPKFAYAYNNRGIAYDNKGDFDQAIRDYTKAMELNPNDAVTYYYNRGIAYGNRGEFDQAIQDYTKAIELNPNDAVAYYYNRGIAYDNKGEFDQAIQDYTKAIELNPNDAVAYYYNRGIAYGKKGELDRAIQDYNEAIKLKSDFAEAYYSRGFAYSNKREFDRAIADFNKAIKLKPNYATYYYRGVAYGNKREFDQAIQDFSKAIELKLDFADAYKNRGIAYRIKGYFDQAIRDYTKAIELNPNDAVAYVNRGISRLHLGEWEKARADLTFIKDMGVDIAAMFRDDHKSVADFEQRYGLALPEDIAAMLA